MILHKVLIENFRGYQKMSQDCQYLGQNDVNRQTLLGTFAPMGLSNVPKRVWSESSGVLSNRWLTETVNSNKFCEFGNCCSTSNMSRTVWALALKFGQELLQWALQQNEKDQTLGWLGCCRIGPRLISSAVVVVLLLLHLNVDYFGSRRSWRALQRWQDRSGVVLDDCVVGCGCRARLDDATTVKLSEIQQGRILLLDWPQLQGEHKGSYYCYSKRECRWRNQYTVSCDKVEQWWVQTILQ